VHPVGRDCVAVRSEPIGGTDIFQLAMDELGLDFELAPEPDRPQGEWFQPLAIPKSKVLEGKDVARDLMTWYEGTRKWVVSSRGDVRLFDVALDPRELTPLSIGDAEQEAALDRARSWWKAHPAMEREATTIKESDVDHLRELGYLGGDE